MVDAKRVAVAERAARAGASVASASFRGEVEAETKRGKTDLVTEADRAAQRRVVEEIHRAYPDETVVGEEGNGGSALPREGVAWVVDPIDGTTNFVRGDPQWTTAVAVVRDRSAVAAAHAAPELGEVFVADADGFTVDGAPATVSDRDDPETFVVAPTMGWGYDDRRGIGAVCGVVGARFGHLRRYGTGQMALSMVAAGRLDGAFTVDEGDPWDRVSGAYMVERAGGTVTGLDGDRWTPDATGLVASNGRRHGALLDAVAEMRDSVER